MPLKPVFDKAPLMKQNRQSLRAGQCRVDEAFPRRLYALTLQAKPCPALLEGAFRLGCLVSSKPEQEPVAEWIRSALSTQQPDGSFDLPTVDAVAVVRAAWALYEYSVQTPVLEQIVRWCGWAAQHVEQLMAEETLRTQPADLLELLQNLYRVTGNAAVLKLHRWIADRAVDWPATLSVFNQQRPARRSKTKEEMTAGLQKEKDAEGYYHQQLRLLNAVSLADGARMALCSSWYSGSATPQRAVRVGWERMERWHGAICGGLSADELLEGASPAEAVGTEALGAWTEALCGAALGEDSAWAWGSVERMLRNALPACVLEEKLRSFQRVNELSAEDQQEQCFYVSPELETRALARLARGCAAVYSSAVMANPDGLTVNLLIPGRYGITAGENSMLLTVEEPKKNHFRLQLRMKGDVRATMRLRVPAWCEGAEITLGSGENEKSQKPQGGGLSITRIWHDGDALEVALPRTLRVESGHHQGAYVLRGAELLALPADTSTTWACALRSAVCREDGSVEATLAPVKDWKARAKVPADIPVRPQTSGDPFTAALVPYAETSGRVTLFPLEAGA